MHDPALSNPHELDRLRRFIYRHSGMFVGDDKNYFLQSRVISRMDALNLDRFTDYFRFLVLDPEREEVQALINCITVNETYFFRDYGQLTGFAEEILPMVVERRRAVRSDSLRVLSAGCSTGEEAYSLAIILREMLDDPSAWAMRVEGVDINTEVLDHARRALYGTRSSRDVPITFRLQYFDDEAGELRVKPIIRNMVHFEYGNLYDPTYMRKFSGVDIVFCRNVLIYFDDESRKRVLQNLYNALRPGGFIFLGHAESASRYTGAFEVVRIGPLVAHRKPLESGGGSHA